jgi:DNA-binding GntR family transcriptional regulator
MSSNLLGNVGREADDAGVDVAEIVRPKPDEWADYALQPGPLSKAQEAHKYIKAKILDGSFSPGYRLVLSRIAAELGISVAPVREAIRILEVEHLVSIEPNVGAQVGLGTSSDYEATMEVLGVVEGYALAHAAPYLTAEDLAEARSVNAQMEECLRSFDPTSFTRLNLEFHTILFERCPNPHMLELVHRGWTRLRSLRESAYVMVPGRAEESVAEHYALIDLIESGASHEAIEKSARDHHLATLNAYLDYRDAKR